MIDVLGRSAAVLTLVVVPEKYRSPVERHPPVKGHADVGPEPDNGRGRNRHVLGMPHISIRSDNFGALAQHEDQGPSCRNHRQRLVTRIQNKCTRHCGSVPVADAAHDMLGGAGTTRDDAVVQTHEARSAAVRGRFTVDQERGKTIDIKNLWIVGTIGIVWIIVFTTLSGSEPLIFGIDPSTNDVGTDVNVAFLVNWFWGLITTVMILRSTVFRRPNEAGYRETNAWPWMTLVVAGVWIVAGLVANNTGSIGIASDSVMIPVGAILALPIAAAVTSYTVEFLIQGFAARNAGITT